MSLVIINPFILGDPPLPTTPGSFTATSGDAVINLTWTDSFYETGYAIERGTDGVSYSALTTPAANATSYNDSTVTNGTTYYYRIRATNAQGNSDWATANAKAGILLDTPLLSTSSIGSTQLTLDWNNVPNATSYEIQISTDYGANYTALDTSAGTPYGVMSLTPDTTYYFRIRATNADPVYITSDWSVTSATMAP